jgi:hypothetical protein
MGLDRDTQPITSGYLGGITRTNGTSLADGSEHRLYPPGQSLKASKKHEGDNDEEHEP